MPSAGSGGKRGGKKQLFPVNAPEACGQINEWELPRFLESDSCGNVGGKGGRRPLRSGAAEVLGAAAAAAGAAGAGNPGVAAEGGV